jgi:hypothetical protein
LENCGVLYLIICVIVFVAIYPSSHNNDSNNPSGYYVNCDDARVQGADPVYSDDLGYTSALDRDGDGVGCEKMVNKQVRNSSYLKFF